ncbi:TonB family protein [Marinagarivorans algicola]|uniref:TonB family protein n=1 Tax=Marinagarivorans algicola TaxID=1513270 RepID=UPI002367947E|nr:TonB family protein [Marinagarivorans algicola]
MHLLHNLQKISNKQIAAALAILSIHTTSIRAVCVATIGSIISINTYAEANMPLNGIGTYNHMGKDYYIVAHYSTLSCTEAKQCEEQNSPAQYSLKVVTSRWTSHSYSLVWQRELATNNAKATVPKEVMPALIKFTQLAETRLTKGDNIDILFDGQNTQISINSAHALTAPGKSLFNYLARVWVGPIPPSRQFKNAMLAGHGGEHNTALVDKFKTLEPASDRMGLLTTWQKQKDDEQSTAELAEEDVKTVVVASKPTSSNKKVPPIEKPVVILKAPSTDIATPITAAPNAGVPIVTETVTTTIAAATLKSKSADNDATNDTATLQNDPPQVEKTTEQPEAEQVAIQKATPEPVKPVASKPKRAPTLTNQQKSALLEWQVNTAIFKNVQYPSWAKQFGQEGSVNVSFTLNPTLEEANIISIKPKQAGLLGDAIVEAIQKSLPLSAKLQPLLQDESKVFTYQHTFSLSKKPIRPSAPALLQDNGLVNSARVQAYLPKQGNQSITSLDDLRGYLKGNIKYPYWAKSLNLRGKVTAEITLDTQGFVKDIKIVKSSRHAEFNQAIIDGAKAAAPFPIMSTDDNVVFEYQHTFKP